MALSSNVAVAAVGPGGFVIGDIYQGGTTQISLEKALEDVGPGSVVVLGEQHGTTVQAAQQVAVMQALRSRGLKVSVGMEFFDVTQQAFVDLYRDGALTEEEFLKNIRWGGYSFDAYRAQVQFPVLGTESVIALNVPRAITSRIAKVGVDALTPEERAFLPADFEVGNEGYKARFREAMGGHIPSEESFLKYFSAQSAWDDVMALNAAQFVKNNQDHVFVIVVGEFHVQYGGGLPDRLKARGVSQVKTISLQNLAGLSDQEAQDAMFPSPAWGPRADFVWTSLIP